MQSLYSRAHGALLPAGIPLLLLLSLSPLAYSQTAAADLDWITHEEMQQLPEDLQRPIPAWCSGTYYAPQFAVPAASENTIIQADSSSYNQTGTAQLSGNVTIKQPDRHLSADNATFNQKTGDFTLTGDIKLDAKSQSFTAQHLRGNTNNKTTQLEDVNYSIFAQNAHGEAAGIDHNGNITDITRGTYSTCAPGQNGWMLAARHIRLDKDKGWGTARDLTLRVKDVPVFYLPWMTFPIDDRRKSGLLFPTFTRTDDGGIDYAQPIYLNIAPQLDMLLAPRFIQGRGVGIETQTRYLTHLGAGKINYALINEDRKFDDQKRQAASWQHSGSYKRWSFNTNVNYVSDDFYFKDLGTSTLDDVSRTNLARTANLYYTWTDWRFQASLQSWQVIDPTLANRNYPYRRLPQLELSGHPDIYGPGEVDWYSGYTYFTRGVDVPGGSLGGSRWHLEPAIKFPFSRSYGYITPQFKVYSSYYKLHGLKSLREDNKSMSVVGSSVDAGLFFERNLDIGDGNYIQTLEPRLFYDYVPYRDQRDLPLFDTSLLPFSYTSLFRENRFLGYDRVGDVNKLAGGITSRIIDGDSGSEIWRFRLGEGYYFQDRRVQLDPKAAPNTSRTTPLVADVTFHMNDHWSLYAQKQWTQDTDLGQQNILRLGYRDPARHYAYIGFRDLDNVYTTNVRQAELAGMWPVSDNWSLLFSELYDLDNNRSVETVAGVEYRDCCWKIRLVNRRLLADYDGLGSLKARTSLMFQIQLIGLGGFGDKVDSLLEDTIPGYRREDQ